MRKFVMTLFVLLSLFALTGFVFADVTGDWNISGAEQFKVKVKKQKQLDDTTQENFSALYSFDSDGTFKEDGQSFGTWTQNKTKVDVLLDNATIIDMLDDMLDDNTYGQTNITIKKTKFKVKESKDETAIKGKYQVKATVDFVTLGTTGKIQLKGTFEGSKSLCIPTGDPDTNCDAVDDDCNGIADDGYVPTPTTCGVGACEATGELVCTENGVIANTCVPNAPQTEGPAGDATCSDSLDNDCDGTTDSADFDCLADRQVSVPDVETDAGSPVQIPVNIDNAEGIVAYQFTVTYDPAVLGCTSVINGILTIGWDEPSVNATAGEITFLSTEPDLIPLEGGTGSVAEIVCTAADNSGASTPVTITSSALSDENANPIPTDITNGSVSIR